MTDLDRENARLDELLADLHVSVSERRNIRDTHIQPRVSAKKDNLLKEILSLKHFLKFKTVLLIV